MLHTMQHGLKLINRCSIVVVQPQILASRKNHFAPLVFLFRDKRRALCGFHPLND